MRHAFQGSVAKRCKCRISAASPTIWSPRPLGCCRYQGKLPIALKSPEHIFIMRRVFRTGKNSAPIQSGFFGCCECKTGGEAPVLLSVVTVFIFVSSDALQHPTGRDRRAAWRRLPVHGRLRWRL